MNNPEKIGNCPGVIGWMFGHNFEHIFEIEEGVPTLVLSSETISGMVASELEAIPDILSASRQTKKRYIHSICNRCGKVVEKNKSPLT